MTDSALPSRRRVVSAIGLGQLLAWGSSYYLLAILARPMATGLGLPPAVVYAEFSAALLLAALLGPTVGGWIDRHGGRRLLMASNLMFAAGLGLLAAAQGAVGLALGWLMIGAAMPMGLYDAAFSTLVSFYRADARRSIVGVTLIAGFASSLSWPLTATLEHHFGWRAACLTWALLHLSVGGAIHRWWLPEPPRNTPLHQPSKAEEPPPPPATLWMLAAVFTCHGFVFAAMAAHLPRVLLAVGCTPVAAVAAASMLGVSQVAARLGDAAVLNRLHPLVSARLSLALHPLAALALAVVGAPLAGLFTVMHGAGVGLMTIVKGTLPLALFGAAGFGRRAGLLEAPSRIAQAVAPIAYGVALDHLGAGALWISGGVAAAGWVGMLLLRAEAGRASAA